MDKNDECCSANLVSKIRTRFSGDNAFMGRTHGLSAMAAFLAAVAFAPEFFYNFLGTKSISVVILAALVFNGWAFFSDYDNTKSTAESSTGILGNVISALVRSISRVVQILIRTKRDDPDPNPHRGFFHTIPASLIMGFLVFLGANIPGEATIPNLGKVSYGFIFAMVITFLSTHIALSGILKEPMKKLKNSSFLGSFLAFLLSFTITALLFSQLPKGIGYQWLGVAVAGGMIIHIIGDTFTTMGTPITFPIPIHGKLWWMTRLTPIKAGGIIENWIFTPIFLFVILFSSLHIFRIF